MFKLRAHKKAIQLAIQKQRRIRRKKEKDKKGHKTYACRIISSVAGGAAGMGSLYT